MSKSLSVLKSDRVNKKKRLVNLYYKDQIREHRRAIKKAIMNSDKEAVEQHHKMYVSFVDKAAKKSIYHKNKAARKKSKMNLVVKNFILGQ